MKTPRIICFTLLFLLSHTLSWAAPVDENAMLARQLAAVIRDVSLPPKARAEAARALGLMGVTGRAAVPELAAILGHPFRGYPFCVDEAMIQALGQMGPAAREAVPAMVQNAGRDCDLDRTIREAVGQILRVSRGATEVAVLIDALRAADVSVRLRAAKDLALLGIDARDAAVALNAALSDTDPDVRRQAFRALLAILPGTPPSDAMLGVLVRDLTDSSAVVRLGAAKALGQFGPAARFSLSALQAAARNDPDEDVRRVAGDAVARIQGGEPPPVP